MLEVDVNVKDKGSLTCIVSRWDINVKGKGSIICIVLYYELLISEALRYDV